MTGSLRAEIVTCARALDAAGLNRGSAGNLSARDGAEMLRTPSCGPAGALEPAMLARMALEDEDGT